MVVVEDVVVVVGEGLKEGGRVPLFSLYPSPPTTAGAPPVAVGEEGAVPMWALILSHPLRRTPMTTTGCPVSLQTRWRYPCFFLGCLPSRRHFCFTDLDLAHWVGPWVKGVVTLVSECVGNEEVRSIGRASLDAWVLGFCG
jgi:hypothetical protein